MSENEANTSTRVIVPKHLRWGVIVGTLAWVLLYPFVFVFPLYWILASDNAAARDLPNPYRVNASVIGDARELGCHEPEDHERDDYPYPAEPTPRSALLHPMGPPMSPWSSAKARALRWVAWVPWFRSAVAMSDVFHGLHTKVSSLQQEVDKHCAEQELRVLRGEREQSIAIYPRLKQEMLRAAEAHDAAVARYQAIKLPFALVMWGWALFELLGVPYMIYVWRQLLRLARQARGQSAR